MLTKGDTIGNYIVIEELGKIKGRISYAVLCKCCSEKDPELFNNNYPFITTEYQMKHCNICACSHNYRLNYEQQNIKLKRKGLESDITYHYAKDAENTSLKKTKIKAKCNTCGKEWEQTLADVFQGSGCFECNLSKATSGKSRKRGLILGAGINDADYPTQQTTKNSEGKRVNVWVCPYYDCWTSMLDRCLSDKRKAKFHTYKDATCCKEWLLFSNFKSWMEQQDWEGKYLDKDLLVYQNKIYSPETCVFVPFEINNFLLTSKSSRGDLPLGVTRVSKIHGKYTPTKQYAASCGHTFTKNNKRTSVRLGQYLTVKEAHFAWKTEKLRLTHILLEKYKNDNKITKGLNRVSKLLEEAIKFDTFVEVL